MDGLAPIGSEFNRLTIAYLCGEIVRAFLELKSLPFLESTKRIGWYSLCV